MKVLLDTHTFLWAASEPKKLSKRVRDFITGDHQPLLSAASLWEISLKVRKGKLEMVDAFETLTANIEGLKLTVIPVRAMHALRTLSLPDHHGDPFDRMIVAQALEEGAAIATVDLMIQRYAVDIFW
jgi:PIN domain nuclease of toxin-antitoxin system